MQFSYEYLLLHVLIQTTQQLQTEKDNQACTINDVQFLNYFRLFILQLLYICVSVLTI
jgi:hypothetical protein